MRAPPRPDGPPEAREGAHHDVVGVGPAGREGRVSADPGLDQAAVLLHDGLPGARVALGDGAAEQLDAEGVAERLTALALVHFGAVRGDHRGQRHPARPRRRVGPLFVFLAMHR